MIGKEAYDELREIERIIGYHMNDENLLMEALTHTSYANLKKTGSYERLEFLGDGVLGLIIRDCIYLKYRNLAEGKMTKMCSALVCEASLAEAAEKMGVVPYIRTVQMNMKRSIIADVFEAILGAVYLDGGMEAAKKFVMNSMNDKIEQARQNKLNRDYKTEIQEIAQSRKSVVTYRTVSEEGQDHDKTYEMELLIDGVPIARGVGKSKKSAHQDAARQAIGGKYEQKFAKSEEEGRLQ
ncbi:MAG: ribonuclease III [Clostridiales bacterium]|nr:ribonuclease III [Clostridiales bacterium]